MISYRTWIVTLWSTSWRKPFEISWLNEEISDASTAVLYTETCLIPQTRKVYSPLETFERSFANAHSTWYFLCLLSSLDLKTFWEIKERFPRALKIRSVPFRLCLVSLSETHWRSFARNFLLSKNTFTNSAWFFVENFFSASLVADFLQNQCLQNFRNWGKMADRSLQTSQWKLWETQNNHRPRRDNYTICGERSHPCEDIFAFRQHQTDTALPSHDRNVQEKLSAPYWLHQHITDRSRHRYLLFWSSPGLVHLQYPALKTTSEKYFLPPSLSQFLQLSGSMFANNAFFSPWTTWVSFRNLFNRWLALVNEIASWSRFRMWDWMRCIKASLLYEALCAAFDGERWPEPLAIPYRSTSTGSYGEGSASKGRIFPRPAEVTVFSSFKNSVG